jgi:hypothetical protein
MRELALERRACNVCGARVTDAYARGASNVEARGVSFIEASESGRPTRAPRERSGLAHAAGFAGVLYLFRYSFMSFALSHVRLEAALGMLPAGVCSLFAPVALVLAFAAAVSLDRSCDKSGALPAIFGLVVGWIGTIRWVFLLLELLREIQLITL